MAVFENENAVDSSSTIEMIGTNVPRAVTEIFKTPLIGSYTWDYQSANGKLRRLYELGKKLNWNASTDIDWDKTIDKSIGPLPMLLVPYLGYPEFEKLSDEKKLEFRWHSHCWSLSQFLHGEQGALLVTSQLVSCAPTYDAKLYAASQTFDEGRHVEVFSRYIQEKIGFMYPVNKNLKALLDKILTDPRWDLKFIGMQIIIEGLALAAFHTMKDVSSIPLMVDILKGVIQDEARHVTFGIIYLEEFIKTLPQHEVEERAQFAFEACVVMRERLIETEVFEHFGWNAEEARKVALESKIQSQFRDHMFTRIIPNLKQIGLLTDKVRPKFEELGLLKYENMVSDGVIDWAKIEMPAY
jgi:hypothetical protein